MSSSRTHANHRRLPSTSPDDKFSASAQLSPIPSHSPRPANGLELHPPEDWKAMASSTAQLVSPPQEHDLGMEGYDNGRAVAYDDEAAEEATITDVPTPEKKWKGKAKAVEGEEIENGVPLGVNTLSYAELGDGRQSYPPLSDEAQEERKITENLKRWEQLERQRRKAARDRTRDRDSTFSLSGDVTRRASLLLRGRGGRGGPKGDRSSMQSQTSDQPLRPAAGAAGGDSEVGILGNGEPTTPSTASTGPSFGRETESSSAKDGNPFSPTGSPPSSTSQNTFSLPYGGGLKATPFRPSPGAHDESQDPFSSRSSLEHIDIQSGSGSSSSYQHRHSQPPSQTGSHFPSQSRSQSSQAQSPAKAPWYQDYAPHLPSLPETLPSSAHPSSALQPPPPLPPDVSWFSPNSAPLDPKSTSGLSVAESLEPDGTDIGDREAMEEADAPRARRWWWLDWLCGCGGNEDEDEDQAGRTNPFE